MGAVYEAIHRGTRRRCALKVLHPGLAGDGDARQRFALEACITATIDSDHIVTVFDAGVDEASKAPYIVMELLKGYSLGQRLEEKRRFSVEEVLEIVGQASRALDLTHAAGIVHRDLKPDNLFALRRADGSVHIKILDFGIAKAVTSGPSRNTTNIGTPLYMAPEQLDGTALDGRADVFALGHIAFELLTGEHYWEPELRSAPSSLALMRIIDRGLPEAPRVRAARLGVQLGPSFDSWFLRATARAPGDRYATASELVNGLAGAVGLPLYTPTLVMELPERMSGDWLPDSAGIPIPARPVGAITNEPTTQRQLQEQVRPEKQTGGPAVWGMATPSRAQRARRLTGMAVALAVVAIASGTSFLFWRSGGDRADAAAGVTSPAATAATAASEESPTGSPTPLVSVAAASSVSASAAGSARTPSHSAGGKPAAPKGTRPPAPKPTLSPEQLCRKDPKRCR